MKVLIFIEGTSSGLKSSSKELLSWCFQNGLKPSAIYFGSNKSVIEEMGSLNLESLSVIEGDHTKSYNSEYFSKALGAYISKKNPDLILGSSSSIGKDLFPRVAAKLDSQVASDCIDIKLHQGEVEVRRPLFSGKALATLRFTGTTPKFVLMRPNQIDLKPLTTGSTQTTVEQPDVTNLRIKVKEIIKGVSEKIDLTEAQIIVSGGRGLKEASNFKLIEELANSIGATVGATRAVVDAGWVPHDMQVGQTGKTVAPTLYFAVGISGAIQHLAGMSGSKVIVAINNDPNAPIFQKATYGIVGDLFQVLPLLTQEFKKVVGH